MSFDIERYKENSARVDLSDIRWDQIPNHPLPQRAIDSMLYMMDIETHTVIFLSELLVSKACMDPVITSFLSIWVYEEMYHGEAFAKFLRAYGVEVSPDRPREIRLKEGFKRVTAVLTILFGSYALPFFPAAYLTVGAVNEMTTLTGYEQLIKRADHPILTTVVQRLIKQERVHFAFYRSMAERLLNESRSARRFVRWMMEHQFEPVGASVKTPEEVASLAMYLFDGADGRQAARRIDRETSRLPGLSDLHTLERLVDESERHFGLPTTGGQPDPGLEEDNQGSQVDFGRAGGRQISGLRGGIEK